MGFEKKMSKKHFLNVLGDVLKLFSKKFYFSFLTHKPKGLGNHAVASRQMQRRNVQKFGRVTELAQGFGLSPGLVDGEITKSLKFMNFGQNQPFPTFLGGGVKKWLSPWKSRGFGQIPKSPRFFGEVENSDRSHGLAGLSGLGTPNDRLQPVDTGRDRSQPVSE